MSTVLALIDPGIVETSVDGCQIARIEGNSYEVVVFMDERTGLNYQDTPERSGIYEIIAFVPDFLNYFPRCKDV